jgi:hypothetical protein
MRQYTKYLGPDVYWGNLARGGHETVVLPVYPAGMLLEPFVKHLAAALKMAMDKAIQQMSLSDQNHQRDAMK